MTAKKGERWIYLQRGPEGGLEALESRQSYYRPLENYALKLHRTHLQVYGGQEGNWSHMIWPW